MQLDQNLFKEDSRGNAIVPINGSRNAGHGQKFDAGFNIQFQEEPDGYHSNRWLTCILVDPINNKGLTRETIRLAMEDENIETRPLWKPMHQQPVFASTKNYINGVSDKLFENGLCLPSGSNLTEEEFERIFNCLDTIFYKLK
jgi:dTDP-4-amino-4,6-dideoxygalactose transaminase